MNEIKKLIDGVKEGIKSTKELGDETDTITMTLAEMEYTAEALREKAERENTKSLTIEELLKMDGEPVWIVENGETKCGVVSLEGNCLEKEPVITLANGNFYLLKEYNGKTWLAYRTRPERSGEK